MVRDTIYGVLEYDGGERDRALYGVIILVDIILTKEGDLQVGDNIRFKDDDSITRKFNIKYYVKTIEITVEYNLSHLRLYS